MVEQNIVSLVYGTGIGVALVYAVNGVRSYVKTDPQIQTIIRRLKSRNSSRLTPSGPNRKERRIMKRREG